MVQKVDRQLIEAVQ